MTEFFEAFNPGARHLREQKEFQKAHVVQRRFSGRGPQPLDLDSGRILLVHPGQQVAGAGPSVRLATGRDVERAARIGVRAVLDGSDLHHTEPWLDRVRDTAGRARDGELWVVLDDGAVVGTVTWCPPGSPLCSTDDGDDGEFTMLAVDPPAQRRGLGRLLVAAMVERAREEGCPGLVASTSPWMTAASRLLRSAGFVPDEGTPVDALGAPIGDVAWRLAL